MESQIFSFHRPLSFHMRFTNPAYNDISIRCLFTSLLREVARRNAVTKGVKRRRARSCGLSLGCKRYRQAAAPSARFLRHANGL